MDRPTRVRSQVSCSIPVLTCRGSSTTLSKVWTVVDGLPTKLEPKRRAKTFDLELLPGTRGLEDILSFIERGDPNQAILRDHPLPDAPHPIRRTSENFEPCSRRWFCIDVDSLEAPESLNWQAWPEVGVGHVLGVLGEYWPELLEADCVYQYSASAGFKPGLRLHLWFWADSPISSKALHWKTTLINERAGTALADPNLYSRVQLHYTGRPVLRGEAKDPLPRRRCGLLKRGGHLQVAELLSEHLASVEEQKSRPASPPRPRPHPPRRAAKSRVKLPYVNAAISKIKTTLDADHESTLYKAALRLASLITSEGVEAALRAEGSSGDTVRSDLHVEALSAGFSESRAAHNIGRGWAKGIANPSNEDVLYYPAPRSSTDPPLEHDRDKVRAEIPVRLEALQPGEAMGLQIRTGGGKTYAKRKYPKTTPPGHLVIYVSKDRRAAIEDFEAIEGSVLLLGKSNAKSKRPRWGGWEPHKTPEGDISTCGNDKAQNHSSRGGRSKRACYQCRTAAVCTTGGKDGALGFRGQWRKIESTLKGGGVIITTPQLLGPVLSKRSEMKRAAPVHDVWFDDVSQPPGATTVEKEALLKAAKELGNLALAQPPAEQETTKRAAKSIKAVADVLTKAEAELLPGEYGEWLKIEETISRLEHIDAIALDVATERDGVPISLGTVAALIRGEAPRASAHIIRSHQSAYLEVIAEPLELPPESRVIISSATAQLEEWEAWLGRPVTRWSPNIPVEASGTWLENSWFHPKTIDNKPVEELLRAARAMGEKLEGQISKANRMLVLAHSKVKDAPQFERMLNELLDGASSKPDTIEIIHWRGIDQVGSDQFNGFDCVITLGSPNMDLQAWHRRISDVDRWEPGKGSTLSYDREAESWVDQGFGRARWPQGLALVHIGSRPGETLRSICPIPLDVGRETGRRPIARNKAKEWLEGLPIRAYSAALHRLPGSPSRPTLHREITSRPGLRWRVRLSGRGRDQIWIGDTRADVESALTWLLAGGGGGRIVISIDPVHDGHVHCSKRSIRSSRPIRTLNDPDSQEPDKHPEFAQSDGSPRADVPPPPPPARSPNSPPSVESMVESSPEQIEEPHTLDQTGQDSALDPPILLLQISPWLFVKYFNAYASDPGSLPLECLRAWTRLERTRPDDRLFALSDLACLERLKAQFFHREVGWSRVEQEMTRRLGPIRIRPPDSISERCTDHDGGI